jgi:hypothetical protein
MCLLPNTSLEPWTTTRTPAQTAGAGSSMDAAQWPEWAQDAIVGDVEERRRSARCRWAARTTRPSHDRGRRDCDEMYG